jgi:hypothetical protein
MLKVAFVDVDGVILVNGEVKTIDLPEFTRNYDTDMVVGTDFTKPEARSIQAAELTMSLKDHKRNPTFLKFVEKAFNTKLIVTLMVLNVDMTSPTVATSDGEFYSGYVSRPGRTVSPDKADDGTIKLQVSDAWRTENGVVVWRLPTGSSDTIGVELVYG